MASKAACRDCPWSWVYRHRETAERAAERHFRRTGHATVSGRMGTLDL